MGFRAVILALLLSGCATSHPIQYVDREVIVACLGPDPKEPQRPKGDYPGDAAALAMMQDYIAELRAYINQLKAQMAGCR